MYRVPQRFPQLLACIENFWTYLLPSYFTMGKNFCRRCQVRHNPPTGRNCSRAGSGDVNPTATSSSDDDLDLTLRNAQDMPGVKEPLNMEQGMDSLEKMIFKLSENVMSLTESRHHRSDFHHKNIRRLVMIIPKIALNLRVSQLMFSLTRIYFWMKI